ncbi:response regulator [bacterium]|nr:response regulator [bacterium]
MKKLSSRGIEIIGIFGTIIVILAMILVTIISGFSASRNAENAAREVSLLFLDELTSRREQVVSQNIKGKINDIDIQISLMDKDVVLLNEDELHKFQTKMKQTFQLEKFAFVDEDGNIYTAIPTENTIDDYAFDYQTISEPEVSIFNLNTKDKKVVIAEKIDPSLDFLDTKLVACFMEIDMSVMLTGVQMGAGKSGSTFSNIYTKDGIALSNTVLGGLAVEDNLIDALKTAEYDQGVSYEKVIDDFMNGRGGTISFTYNGIRETLSYEPISGTDWFLTYLIRESLVTEEVKSVSSRIILWSILTTSLTTIILISMFVFIIYELNKNSKILLEKESIATETRVKEEELNRRIELQNQLLEQEKDRTQQSRMIKALSKDYYSVYYIDLKSDSGVCYQAHEDIEDGLNVGDNFKYLESFKAYAEKYVDNRYLDDFLNFIQIENIRNELHTKKVISFRYIVNRHDHESYEMVKYARVSEDENDINAVGACFTNVDEETRASIAQNEILSSALQSAEQASKAKTVFLSNMSHEIRTPMNAIIGLSNIALNDPDISSKTRNHLEKIDASAEHLLSLINDILDMSRIESGRLILRNEDFSFARLIEQINSMFSGQCQEKGIDYHCIIDSEISDYYNGDNTKLKQILINLIGNAVKFTDKDGKVSLSIKKKAEIDNKETLEIVVEDTGVGISEEFLPQIFETFTQENPTSTNKYGSSGLGLAITKNIVEMMNGDIRVESKKNEGTKFTVTITLSKTQSNKVLQDYRKSIKGVNALIVDDDTLALEHATLILNKIGIKSETASSGMEGIKKVEQKLKENNPYKLILVDWKMPEMDGVETSKSIRKIVGSDSTIIMLTAYKWDDVIDDAQLAGIDSFIAKPLFANSLIEEFENALVRKDLKNDSIDTILSDKKILLVEDMEINAVIIKAILEMQNVKVEWAENGKIAVDMFKSHDEYYYDAILMDMKMPVMDGLEATRLIRSLDKKDSKSIPIIALTASAFDEDVQRSIQAGLNSHLTKPIQPYLLFETLKQYIKIRN